MNDSNELLAEIYRGAEMGTQSIDLILNKVSDPQMKKELIRERKAYEAFGEKAADEITNHNETPEPVSKMQEMGAWMGIQMNTLLDKSPSHIADLMIQGNDMGIIGITKSVNKHKDADDAAVNLANELVRMQQQHIENLKKFL